MTLLLALLVDGKDIFLLLEPELNVGCFKMSGTLRTLFCSSINGGLVGKNLFLAMTLLNCSDGILVI